MVTVPMTEPEISLCGLCRNDRTEAARRTCRCLLQSRMTRLSPRRRHNFRKNAVRDAENFRLTPMPQISVVNEEDASPGATMSQRPSLNREPAFALVLFPASHECGDVVDNDQL